MSLVLCLPKPLQKTFCPQSTQLLQWLNKYKASLIDPKGMLLKMNEGCGRFGPLPFYFTKAWMEGLVTGDANHANEE